MTENWVNRYYIHRWKVQKLNIMLLKDIKRYEETLEMEVINSMTPVLSSVYINMHNICFFGCGPF